MQELHHVLICLGLLNVDGSVITGNIDFKCFYLLSYFECDSDRGFGKGFKVASFSKHKRYSLLSILSLFPFVDNAVVST